MDKPVVKRYFHTQEQTFTLPMISYIQQIRNGLLFNIVVLWLRML